jgi:transposase
MIHIDLQRRSSLEFREQEMILHLKASLFPPSLWQHVCSWFSGAWQSSWLVKPFLSMSTTEDREGQPRWKQTQADLLSYLIFCFLVPFGHPLVQLWRRVDWAAINRLCASVYHNQRWGQRAWAPAQLIALLLLFVLLPVPSETVLLAQVSLSPLYRWFCGFGLFSPLPDHSSLHTFRKRIGVERFEAILTWVVLQCQQAGLITNQQSFFDMTGVEASAHRWNPYERAILLTHALIRYLERSEQHPDECLSASLCRLVAEAAIEVQDNEGLRKKTHLAPRLLRSLERWTNTKRAPLWAQAIEEAVSALLAEAEPYPEGMSDAPEQWRAWLKSIARNLKARLPHARGDLDARVGWTSDVTLLCGYWLGFLVDSLHHVITAVRLMPLNQMQHEQMVQALDQHKARLGTYPPLVVADSAQDYDHVHQALDQRQIQGHIASREHRGRGGGWGPAHFLYNSQEQLICPQGEILEVGRPRKDGLVPHSAKGCPTCPLKAKCLPKGQQPDGPRVIHLVPETHRRWLQNRENTRTASYKQAQKKRFASEGLFGLAGRLHQAKKTPYRSEPMNYIAGLLIGIAMNLTVLMRHSSGSVP